MKIYNHIKPKKLSKSLVAILSLLACFMWSSAFPLIKLSYISMQITSDFEMVQFAGLRFISAGVMLFALCLLFLKTSLLPPKSEWFAIASITLLQIFGTYFLFYIGLSNTTAIKASILSSAEMFLTIIMASLFFQESINLRKIAGLVLGTLGIIVVNISNWRDLSLSFAFNGEGYIILKSFLVSLTVVILKKFARPVDVFRVNAWSFLIGGIMLWSFGYQGTRSQLTFTKESILLLLGLATVSAVAFSIWYSLIKFVNLGEITVYKFSIPLIASILSAILIKSETLSWHVILGLVFVMSGIIVANINLEKNKIHPQLASKS